jgi:molybdate transport system substrate-binding protein
LVAAGSPSQTPSGVPAGKYGKAALEALGVWPSVADKLAG